MRLPLLIHKNAPLANVCSVIGTIVFGVGAYTAHTVLSIGIVLLIIGLVLVLISNIIANKERVNDAKYILNKDGTYTCNDCNNIITTVPCPFCQKKSEDHMMSLENSIPCKNCGAFVDTNCDVCHVCGEKIR